MWNELNRIADVVDIILVSLSYCNWKDPMGEPNCFLSMMYLNVLSNTPTQSPAAMKMTESLESVKTYFKLIILLIWYP
jgi:hypothetical protein